MGRGEAENDPTGVGYLKTYQALFQMFEFALGLVLWSMVVSQPYTKYAALHFAVAVFVLTWVITLTFFIIYITGTHNRMNNFFASRSSSAQESGESTSGSLAPPSGDSVPKVRWFVVEYILYMIMTIFLFVAVICLTSQLHGNTVFIAACVIGWFLVLLYELHFCLLFRNVEGIWPTQWCYSCLTRHCGDKSRKSETESLVKSETPDAGATDQLYGAAP